MGTEEPLRNANISFKIKTMYEHWRKTKYLDAQPKWNLMLNQNEISCSTKPSRPNENDTVTKFIVIVSDQLHKR